MEDVVIPKHTVIQYVRDKNGNPRGVLVAVKNGNYCGPQSFKVGYSLCNKKDSFSKNMALKIALGRAVSVDHCYPGVVCYPREVQKMLPAFFERCKRYYKV